MVGRLLVEGVRRSSGKQRALLPQQALSQVRGFFGCSNSLGAEGQFAKSISSGARASGNLNAVEISTRRDGGGDFRSSGNGSSRSSGGVGGSSGSSLWSTGSICCHTTTAGPFRFTQLVQKHATASMLLNAAGCMPLQQHAVTQLLQKHAVASLVQSAAHSTPSMGCMNPHTSMGVGASAVMAAVAQATANSVAVLTPSLPFTSCPLDMRRSGLSSKLPRSISQTGCQGPILDIASRRNFWAASIPFSQSPTSSASSTLHSSPPPQSPGDVLSTKMLEDLLAEMQQQLNQRASSSSSSGGGVRGLPSADEDAFMASVRLRLAQAYVQEGRDIEEVLRQAEAAWQFFEHKAEPGDIVRAMCLHLIGLCKARMDDREEALKWLQQALHAVEAARKSESHQRSSAKQRGGRSKGATTKGAAATKGTEAEKVAALSASRVDLVEYACHMMVAELLGAWDESVQDAVPHLLAALRVSQRGSFIEAAGTAGAKEACRKLAHVKARLLQFDEALSYANRAGLLEPLPQQSMMAEASMLGKAAGGGVGARAEEGAAEAGGNEEGESVGEEGEGEGEEEEDAWLGEKEDSVGAREVRLTALEQRMSDKRLAAAIFAGKDDYTSAVRELRALKSLLQQAATAVDVPDEAAAVDVAGADVLIAEMLLRSDAEAAASVDPAEGLVAEEGPTSSSSMREEALALLESAMETQKAHLGEASPALASTFALAADVCSRLGKADAAEGYCDASLAVLNKWEALETLRQEEEKQLLQQQQKQQQQEQETGIESGTGGNSSSRGDDSRTAEMSELMAQVSSVFSSLGRQADALVLLRRSADALQGLPGRDLDCAITDMEVASLAIALEDSSTALRSLKRAEATWARVPEPDNYAALRANMLFLRGCAHDLAGDSENAMHSVQEAKVLLQRAGGTRSQLGYDVYSSLAAGLYAAGRFKEAGDAQRTAVDVAEALDGKDGEETAQARERLKEYEAAHVK